jgi:hypothetical protein
MNLQSQTQEYSAPTLSEELERCREYIEAALTHSGGRATHKFQDIVEGVTKNQYQFWPGDHSCMITELVAYPEARGVHVFLAGGDLEEILEMEKSLTIWAKSIGADHLSLSGRPGWVKALKAAGWGHPLTSLSKEI